MGTHTRPGLIQQDISDRLKVPPENVTVNMTFLGGGFGRKAFTDYTAEACSYFKRNQSPWYRFFGHGKMMHDQGPFQTGRRF